MEQRSILEISSLLEKGEEAAPVDGGVATELLSPGKERRRATKGEASFYGRW